MIHVFQRHCVFGPNSPSWNKQQTRPKWFDREKNFNNLHFFKLKGEMLSSIFYIANKQMYFKKYNCENIALKRNKRTKKNSFMH